MNEMLQLKRYLERIKELLESVMKGKDFSWLTWEDAERLLYETGMMDNHPHLEMMFYLFADLSVMDKDKEEIAKEYYDKAFVAVD